LKVKVMNGIETVILFLATVLGAVTTSALGWLDSNTPFDARKFIPSLIRGIIAAIIVYISAYAGYVGTVNFFTYLAAYLAGGGFDTVINRLSGIVQKPQTPTPAAPTST
jgi:hypothetical protein